MLKLNFTNLVAAAAVGVLIGLIGLVTYFSSQTINRATESIGKVSDSIDRTSTSISRASDLIDESILLISQAVVEQFRSHELQLVTSLSQQTETYFAGLNADITSLSLQPYIKRVVPPSDAVVLELMEQHAQQYPGVIRTIIRYNYRGEAQYAWPVALDNALGAGEAPPYNLPSRLVQQTQDGQEVPLDIELIQASRRDDPAGTFLLIAPVYTDVRRTEFIVYELDLGALFAQMMQFVELDSRGQLWVIDSTNNVLYQANDAIPLESLLDAIPLAALLSFPQPAIEEYTVEDDQRLAMIAPIRTQSKMFVVILSRDLDVAHDQVRAELEQARAVQGQALADQEQARAVQKEALADQEQAQSDLKQIFALSAGAVIMLASLAVLSMRRFAREQRRRQEEASRRQTARTLLEVSRALNSTLDLQDVLRRILAELYKIVPYDSAAVFLLDRSKLVMVAHRGADMDAHRISSPRSNSAEPVVFDLEEAYAAYHVLQTGRPFVIDDTRADERWSDSPLAASEIRSWMGIPLRVRDKTVGVLNLNSHRVARYTDQEIELAEAFADQASVALQNARLHEMEVRQIEQELSIARDIQTSLLPSTTPTLPQLEIAAISIPARQVSGDYFQYLPMSDGRLAIAVGDVSGKGIPAAMLMAVITTAMRDEASRNSHPADLLNALNARLLERMKATHVNSALLVAVFDPVTRHLEIANAGMVQPYVRGDAEWMFVPVGGYPLGVAQRLNYSSRTVTLAPGALLLMMSDGVVEAQNADGEFFGFERLETLLNGLPYDTGAKALLDTIIAAVYDHLGGAEPQDDLTMVALRSLEVPTGSELNDEQPETRTVAGSALPGALKGES